MKLLIIIVLCCFKLISTEEIRAIKEYSVSDGNIFNGWAWSIGSISRTEGYISNDFTFRLIVESIWGDKILSVYESMTDWWGIDSSYLAKIPAGGTKWVEIFCGSEHCGPESGETTFRPLIKKGSISWGKNLVYKIDGAEMNLKNIEYKASLTNHNYKPKFQMTCKNIKIANRQDSHTVQAAKGTIKSIAKIVTEETSTLTSSSTTSHEWFLEAAMNGGDKIGLEIPIEGAKLGVEKSFSWSVKGSTKYTTTQTTSNSLTYKRNEESTLGIDCKQDDSLYLITRTECVVFNFKDCVASNVLPRYENYKFEDSEFNSCHSYQFPMCAPNTNTLNKDLKEVSAIIKINKKPTGLALIAKEKDKGFERAILKPKIAFTKGKDNS